MSDPIYKLPPIHDFEIVHDSELAGDKIPYHVGNYNMDDIWEDHDFGRHVKVAVLDTGVDEDHMENGDLEDAIDDAADFTGSLHGFHDINNHGTHCLGIIGARDNNEMITSGLPESKLASYKVLGDNGFGSDSSIVKGIQRAMDWGAHIINMSFGSGSKSTRIIGILQEAIQQGVMPVGAAGNEGQAGVGWPGKWSEIFAIGANDSNLRLANFSSRGPEVDYVGAGVNILSLIRNGGLGRMSGTSMATPHICSCFGAIYSACIKWLGKIPFEWTKWGMIDFISSVPRGVMDLGPTGKDPGYGRGAVDVQNIVKHVKSLADDPKPEPPPVEPSNDTINVPEPGTYKLQKVQNV